MRKKYILDTSALINDPICYRKFNNSTVIIPVSVLGELDNLKKQQNEAGKQARVAIKLLDEISNKGDISSGISLKDNNISLKVDTTHFNFNLKEYKDLGDPSYGDTQILACACMYNKKYPKQVTLVSNDINLRVKAKARKILAIEHKEKGSFEEIYSGVKIINNEDAGYELQANSFINPSKYSLDLNPNECVLFQHSDGKGISIGRKVEEDKICLIKKNTPWGISSRSKEQAFAIDMLMDTNVDLVTMLGKAGSGKSLVALACALELVLQRKAYDKLIIYRPIQEVGQGIGFLPGDIEQKLAPWFQAILDSFEFLLSKKNQDWKKELDLYKTKGRIEMEAIAYIRGRSIPNAIIMVDEVQNLTKDEIKTILTRAGENTKIILTGDIEQIDNNRLDYNNNGLSYVIDKFKTSSLAGHMTFVHGERSRLATLSANIL